MNSYKELLGALDTKYNLNLKDNKATMIKRYCPKDAIGEEPWCDTLMYEQANGCMVLHQDYLKDMRDLNARVMQLQPLYTLATQFIINRGLHDEFTQYAQERLPREHKDAHETV